MDGILVVNKPLGWTSHDVVAHVRRLAREKRVGHAGTLDPMATGVLLVCLGRATRVTEYLMASDKTYRATVRLGVETDTHDADGQVLATRPVDADESDVRRVLARFVGEIDQVPPMYSALKREGKPLYKLARKGLAVERAPRGVVIHEITLRAWQPPDLAIDVRCSPGTYVRSLAHDVGAALGCGAHLSQLTRLASGSFTLDDAVTLQDLAGLESLSSLLRPLDAALQGLPPVTLDTDQAQCILTGRAIALGAPERLADPPLRRAYDAAGALLAIIVYDPHMQLWRPHKVLAGERQD
jgi:tRNA pseudouridine55 synthase